MNGHLSENPKILNQITKSLKDLATKISQQEKEDSKWTPAVARAYGMRIDQKIKSLGRSGLNKPSVEDKLDSIIRMLMGVSSGNLMTLAVSRKGGMLAKAALAKGLVTEDQANDCYDYGQGLLSFSQFNLVENLYEKLFDGKFERKTYQHEALEFLQSVGKIVDGRKINVEKLTLRNGVFALIKRPMTASGTGYFIVKVIDDGSGSQQESEITINPRIESFIESLEVQAKVVKNYSGPASLSAGKSIYITNEDCHAVSEDNKRYYLTFIPDHKPKDDEVSDVEDAIGDFEDEMKDVKKSVKKIEKTVKKESYLFEKSLSNDEIQDLIDGIKKKLKNRTDKNAQGILKLTKAIEKTFKNRGSLHPMSVVTIMRISNSIAGKWGKNSKDWTGKPPSGRLNKYPPSPSVYANA